MIFRSRHGAALAVAVVALGCGGGGTEPRGPVANTITVSPAGNFNLVAGDTRQLVATVLDENGEPMPDAVVAWSSSNGALVSVSSTGVVSGTTVGSAQISASIGTVTSTPQTITIVAGPPASVTLGSPRIVLVDSGSSHSPTWSAVDAYGNDATAGLSYVARTSAVLLSGTGTVTGVRGGQSVVVAQSATNFSIRDSMLVIVGRVNGPVVVTDIDRFDLRQDTTFTVTLAVDMRTSGEDLGSTGLTITWPTTLLTYVSDEEAGSAVGATVNAGDAATGTLKIAVAGSSGWPGRVEIRRITFTSANATPRSGTLGVALTELAGAETFTNLQPLTVAASYPLVTRP